MKYGTFKYGNAKYGKQDTSLTFVTDRTFEDVLLRRQKGFLSTSDMNRIGNNINKVLSLLNIADESSYVRTNYINGEWVLEEFFQEWTVALNFIHSKIRETIPLNFGWDSNIVTLHYSTLNKVENCIKLAYNILTNAGG